MCIFCNAGWHWECGAPVASEDYLTCCCVNVAAEPVKIPGTRAQKDDSLLIDQTSTGRKRAAQLKPITEGMLCEWTGLKYAGGGVVPIVGCNGNPAKNIHHGPDKSTVNNADHNLHRICPSCHNRWHSANDEYYGERPGGGKPFIPLEHEMLPHDYDTRATIEEMYEAEVNWLMRKDQRDNERVQRRSNEEVVAGIE